MKRCLVAVLGIPAALAVFIGEGTIPTQAQTRAPGSPLLWFGDPNPSVAMEVFHPQSNTVVATAAGSFAPNPTNFGSGPYHMDCGYPASNGYRTVVQVETGLQTGSGIPSFVRWAVPPTMPGPLVPLVFPGQNPVPSGTIPLAMSIPYDPTGRPASHLLTVENVGGVTYVGHYVPFGPGWVFGTPGAFQLGSQGQLFPSAVMTVDRNNHATIAAKDLTGPAPLLFRYRWQFPYNTAPQLLDTIPLAITEDPVWITAERECAPQYGTFPNGKIWVVTAFTPFSPGTLYYADPTGAPPGLTALPVGLSAPFQMWPDTQNGIYGWGIWGAVRNQAGAPFGLLNVSLSCPNTCVPPFLHPLPLQPDAIQMAPRLVGAGPHQASLAMNFSLMPAVFQTYTTGGIFCPSPPPLAGSGNAVAVPTVLGTGWPYSEYIRTGLITWY